MALGVLLSAVAGMLSVGDRVRLAGLVAKPELNGREGTVVSLGDRIGVKLDGAEKPLAIQPQNLEIEVVTERGVRLRTHEGLDGAIGPPTIAVAAITDISARWGNCCRVSLHP